MRDRRVRTIGDVEAEASAKMFRDHGARLAEHHALDRAERAAEAAGPVLGISRHAAELAKRRQRAAELRHELARPLHRDCLTADEKRAIRVTESLRRRPVRAP